MAKPIGPTIPRWQLGEQLQRLRIAAGYSRQQTAQRLRCSVSKIEKVEGGQVRAKLAELETMLAEYGVPEDEWPPLLELQRLGATRGWWSKFGRLPLPFTEFLGLEMAAETIRTFELAVVPGLFQTEPYARALTESDTVGMTPEWLEREVGLRMDRQKQILSDDPPQILLVLDEAALRRQIGGPKVMRDQLAHLVDLAKTVHLQVVPFEHGGYPGIAGRFVVFDFPEDLHSPVVYVESQAGNLYMEKGIDIRRCSLAFDHLLGAALSRPKSVALIKDIARHLE
ncbi:transcriptional regulator [Actinocatenispora thailandica]|uniref:Transcriptional regulator n=1 Tax=Actinocatenispora thailandica TaxID=227318 RepID=A0A7R7DUG5_9ACTN|nr:helix-turn-helix transcriptional regulator [Actinocatenispora thailandica]BCJ37981.1 transcriptional regulator [Actinocatenispora thailandica]